MNKRSRHILKTLTFRRAFNVFLLRLSYGLARVFRKPIHWGMPMAASIEPTTACNLRCPQCPSGLRKFTRETGNLKPELNTTILDELGPGIQYLNYYFQGEPFIHPQFTDLVTEARARNIYVVTSTNAHFIDETTAEKIIESGLNEAIVSIDGTTQETYEQYRKEGSLEKVLEGTKTLLKVRKERKSELPIVTFQFLVTRHNEHEMEELKRLASELGVDRISFKTVQIYDFESGNELIPENPEFSRYEKQKDGTYWLKNSYKNSCWRMWSSCVITWDGKIVPCCFDKDATHVMGKIGKEPFKKQWKSSVYKGFREKIFKDRKQIEICRNCSEGTKTFV